MTAYGSRMDSSRDLMMGCVRYSMMRRVPTRISQLASMPGMSLAGRCDPAFFFASKATRAR